MSTKGVTTSFHSGKTGHNKDRDEADCPTLTENRCSTRYQFRHRRNLRDSILELRRMQGRQHELEYFSAASMHEFFSGAGVWCQIRRPWYHTTNPNRRWVETCCVVLVRDQSILYPSGLGLVTCHVFPVLWFHVVDIRLFASRSPSGNNLQQSLWRILLRACQGALELLRNEKRFHCL